MNVEIRGAKASAAPSHATSGVAAARCDRGRRVLRFSAEGAPSRHQLPLLHQHAAMRTFRGVIRGISSSAAFPYRPRLAHRRSVGW